MTKGGGCNPKNKNYRKFKNWDTFSVPLLNLDFFGEIWRGTGIKFKRSQTQPVFVVPC